jgi:hypothetical protein
VDRAPEPGGSPGYGGGEHVICGSRGAENGRTGLRLTLDVQPVDADIAEGFQISCERRPGASARSSSPSSVRTRTSRRQAANRCLECGKVANTPRRASTIADDEGSLLNTRHRGVTRLGRPNRSSEERRRCDDCAWSEPPGQICLDNTCKRRHEHEDGIAPAEELNLVRLRLRPIRLSDPEKLSLCILNCAKE